MEETRCLCKWKPTESKPANAVELRKIPELRTLKGMAKHLFKEQQEPTLSSTILQTGG